MANLLNLAIVNNVSEAAKVNGNVVAIQVTTTEAATVTILRSLDAKSFSVIPDLEFTINGIDEFNLTDLVPGQYLKVSSTGEMTECKILG